MKDLLKNKKYHIINILLLGLTSVLLLWPYLRHGVSYGLDSNFHLSRLFGLSNYFQSPNNFNIFMSSGKLANLFYPTITTLPFLLIWKVVGIFFGNLASGSIFLLSVKTFVFITLLLCALSSYSSMYLFSKKFSSSFMFALIYICSNYLLMNIYQRFALGEMLSAIFLPVFLIGLYELFYRDEKKWWVFVAGITLIVYSHLLTFILAIGFTIIFAIVSVVFNKSIWNKKRIKYILLSVLFSLLLSLVVIVPIVEQFLSNQIHSTWKVFSFQPLSLGMKQIVKNNISKSFLLHGLGPVIFGGIVFSLITIVWQSAFQRTLTILSLLMLLAQTKLFPWFLFDNSALLQIQFLYRFNMIITLFISFNISIICVNLFSKFENKFKHLKKIAVAILVIFSLVQVGISYRAINYNYKHQAKINEKKVIKKIKNYHNWDYTSKKQFEACENYQYKYYLMRKNDPIKSRMFYCRVHNKEIFRSYTNSIYLDDKKINIKVLHNSNTYKLRLSHNIIGNLVLPLTITKGIEINLNGKLVKPIMSKYGTLLVKLSHGDKLIKITYKWTLLARLCQFVSLVTLIIFIIFIFRNKH